MPNRRTIKSTGAESGHSRQPSGSRHSLQQLGVLALAVPHQGGEGRRPAPGKGGGGIGREAGTWSGLRRSWGHKVRRYEGSKRASFVSMVKRLVMATYEGPGLYGGAAGGHVRWSAGIWPWWDEVEVEPPEVNSPFPWTHASVKKSPWSHILLATAIHQGVAV